jgi:hypothetical protein
MPRRIFVEHRCARAARRTIFVELAPKRLLFVDTRNAEAE